MYLLASNSLILLLAENTGAAGKFLGWVKTVVGSPLELTAFKR